MSLKESLSKIIKISKYERVLFVILLAAFFLRFWQLGYSHFYGDETKTFYLDKTIPAYEFFLDQRKGPVQFAVVWVSEKIFSGHDEFLTRLPFAWAGILGVLVFYLLVQKIFDQKTALASTSLFSLNGFFIAFSRTVQYQSFLVLFGLLAVYFAYLFYETEGKSSKHYSFLTALFLGLAFLCHYDAVFYAVPVVFLLIKKLTKNTKEIKNILPTFITPLFVIVGAFYVPYLIYGYFSSNTVNYIGSRLTGTGFEENMSWYTFWVYNPSILWPLLLGFLIFYFFRQSYWKRNMILLWFFIPFIVFEYIFSNPGTHILNYFMPLIMLIGLGTADLYSSIKRINLKNYYLGFLGAVFILIFTTSLKTYVPYFNSGYPWNAENFNNKAHLYLYGFPYDRGWDQIAEYVKERGGVRSVYTNDNDTVAQYYLHGIAYSRAGTNYLPEFYVHVENNQEHSPFKQYMKAEDMDRYFLEKEFFVNGTKTASFYRLKK